MANRRMIGKSISISEQVNDLSDFAALLFSCMIPHSDDWGILPGSPKKIKALVIPMRKQTERDVEKALREIADAGLIWWYEIGGNKYVQFCKWDEHQEGLHKRTKSKFPEFPGSSENIQEIPGQGNLSEEKRREENCIPFSEIINHLNLKTGKSFKGTTPKTQECIRARWNEGFRLDDFKKVIDIKTAEWKGTEQDKYLRPETLFGTKFEGYLNQSPKETKENPKPANWQDSPVIQMQLEAKKKREMMENDRASPTV